MSDLTKRLRAQEALTSRAISIPSDAEAREALYNFAGLTDDERAAIDAMCFQQAVERQQGVVGVDEAGRK